MKYWLAVVFGLGCICSVANAEDSAATTENSALDAFADLKYRGLVAEAEITSILHPFATSAAVGPRIYISAPSAFTISRVVVTVDGNSPVEQNLKTPEAKALAGTGVLYWMDSAAVPAGAHNVHASIIAADKGQPGQEPQTFEADAAISADDAGSALEFNLLGSSLLNPARLEVHEDHARATDKGWLQRALSRLGPVSNPGGLFAIGSVDDPRVRHSHYLSSLGQYDAAAIELLGISRSAALDSFPDSFSLDLAAALRLARLPKQAAAVCDGLDAKGAEREAVGVERLRLGILQHRLGDSAEAEKQLLSARDRLPADRVQDWQVAYAQIQFDRDQFPQALLTLKNDDDERIDAYRYMDQSVEALRTSSFRRFNLAVAMVHQGDRVRGLSLLDIVGRLKSDDSELLDLRDKANLTLGWQFLRDKQGATAMGILGRVRSEGQFSNKALLGMGWAQLEPGGTKSTRARINNDLDNPFNPLPAAVRNSLTQLGVLDPQTRGGVGPRNFASMKPAKTREEGFQRALTFWDYLSKRDPRSSATQEGLLAIAYAYASLGDTAHARDAYDRAIAALEAQKQDLSQHESEVGRGDLSVGISSAKDAANISSVMDALGLSRESSGDLYASVDRYRDLVRLKKDLADLQSATAARTDAPETSALLQEVDTAREAESAKLTLLAQRQLDFEKDGINDYLKAAYFAAARASDSVQEASSRN